MSRITPNKSTPGAPRPLSSGDGPSSPAAPRGDRPKRHFGLENARNLFQRLLGERPSHEGRFDRQRGIWTNWNGDVQGAVSPKRYFAPRDLDELKAVFARVLAEAPAEGHKSGAVRVVGGGHSFNTSTLTEGAMVSLDGLDRVQRLSLSEAGALAGKLPPAGKKKVDGAAGLVRVQAGIRLHALNHQLERNGLALPVCGSTDVQSLGGLIATDVHGTGFRNGFLSEQLVELTVLERDGELRTYHPGEPGFHHAIGGLGETGIVVEAVLACVPSFRLEKSSDYLSDEEAEQKVMQWVRDPGTAPFDHVSLYYFAGVAPEQVNTVRMNTWRRTDAPVDSLAGLEKTATEAVDLFESAYRSRMLREASKWMPNNPRLRLLDHLSPTTVLPSHEAFARKLFFLHDEIEYGVPLTEYRACMRELMTLLHREDFDSVIEVRFTPGDRSAATLGPGVGGEPKAFIELATPLDLKERIGQVYPKAEQILLRHGGQPHLGKKTYLDSSRHHELNPEYRRRLEAFLAYRDEKGGIFSNAFTNRLFGQVK